jgi:hypothetical protein
MNRLSTALLCGILVLCAAPSARAQAVVSSLEELRLELAPGQTVSIQDRDGKTISGTLSAVTAQAITLRRKTGDVQTVAADRVAAVATVDSNENGMLVGAGVGAVPAVIMGAMLGTRCANEGGSCLGHIGLYGGMFIGIGTAIGYAVDSASDNGKRFTLTRFGVGTETRVTVSPVASLRGGGLRFTW